jgi:hypothetical protein
MKRNFKLYSKSIQAGATITANQYWNNFGCSGPCGKVFGLRFFVFFGIL